MNVQSFLFISMVVGTIFLPLCSAFQSPKRFTSVGFSTRVAASKISLVSRSQTMSASLEPVFTSVSSFFQTHMKSKMIVLGNILASVVVQLIPFALLFFLYKSIMFFVSLGKKNDEPNNHESTSNIIEVGDSEVGTGVSTSAVQGFPKRHDDQSNRLNTELLLTDEKDQVVRREQAEEEARLHRLKVESEARKKEEAYQQQARLSRFKQQRATEKAAQYTYSSQVGMTDITFTTTFRLLFTFLHFVYATVSLISYSRCCCRCCCSSCDNEHNHRI